MTSERPHRARGRLLIALPLVCSLLAASLLLWSRADPARQGGFCTNATAELEGIALILQAEPERMQDLTWVLNELVERVDVERLSATVPEDLRDDAQLLVKLDAAHDRAVEDAVARGLEPPKPSPELTKAFVVMMVRYLNDCVSTSGANDIVDRVPATISRPPGGQ